VPGELALVASLEPKTPVEAERMKLVPQPASATAAMSSVKKRLAFEFIPALLPASH
jgi:hypothetical protein